jgi:hypothetical protein
MKVTVEEDNDEVEEEQRRLYRAMTPEDLRTYLDLMRKAQSLMEKYRGNVTAATSPTGAPTSRNKSSTLHSTPANPRSSEEPVASEPRNPAGAEPSAETDPMVDEEDEEQRPLASLRSSEEPVASETRHLSGAEPSAETEIPVEDEEEEPALPSVPVRIGAAIPLHQGGVRLTIREDG